MSTTFNPGTFTPAPKRTSAGAMLLAQGTMEAKLMLRHGEQHHRHVERSQAALSSRPYTAS